MPTWGLFFSIWSKKELESVVRRRDGGVGSSQKIQVISCYIQSDAPVNAKREWQWQWEENQKTESGGVKPESMPTSLHPTRSNSNHFINGWVIIGRVLKVGLPEKRLTENWLTVFFGSGKNRLTEISVRFTVNRVNKSTSSAWCDLYLLHLLLHMACYDWLEQILPRGEEWLCGPPRV